MLGVLIRAATYATLLIGVVLVYLPARTLTWTGVPRPERLGLPQIAGGIHVLESNAICVLHDLQRNAHAGILDQRAGHAAVGPSEGQREPSPRS